jgi:hypothetical protein
MKRFVLFLSVAVLLTVVLASLLDAEPPTAAVRRFLAGEFRWTVGAPLVSPAERPDDFCYSVKDPSVVQFDGRWHLFCTIRSQKRSHQIEYLNFENWSQAKSAQRHILSRPFTKYRHVLIDEKGWVL